MMTTCRLLCALLVLVLCCCPSVCVTAQDSDAPPPLPEGTGGKGAKELIDKGGSTMTSVPSETPKKEDESAEESHVDVTSEQDLTRSQEAASERPTQPNEKAETVTDETANTSSSADGTEEGKVTPVQTSTPGTPPVTGEKSDTEAQSNFEQKPITTTTTTTTTAPKAPIDTARNTEAPSTTTTRAPSRLREIDGSLSSSAWVCAPLLLAVSALAYTTLG
ncbi:mucin TcMUCII, putative [Trypanosoma cruzi marinkellei]|uniref:Mucin TcMUCII, putative n=1 Tax=Trypanosoma cruzi marinkellei TaxID=85056 RepID=K2MTP5_TRYCR|nr:mucin TcMUCII, putative [Trypanosoma cruzi marinkellei]